MASEIIYAAYHLVALAVIVVAAVLAHKRMYKD